MVKSKGLLRQKVEQALAPKVIDVKEDDEREGAAQIFQRDSDDDDDINDYIPTKSKLRNRAQPKLADFDPRYRGKVSSRRSLKQERQGDEEGGRDSDDDETEHQQADLGSMFEMEENEKEESGVEEGDDSDEEEDDEEEVDEESDKEDQIGDMFEHSDEMEEEEQEEESIPVPDSSNLLEKGRVVRSQIKLYEKLLECRIQMQKVLTRANQYPTAESWKQFQAEGDEQYLEGIKKSKSSAVNLLDEILDLQTTMMNRTVGVKRPNDSDEMRDEEEEFKVGKKRKLSEYSENLTQFHEILKPYRNETIEKWNDKTRLLSGNVTNKSFTGFETSVLKQIEHILSDKERLVLRTQTKRSSYRILGQPEVENAEKLQSTSNEVIFDDDDFYHQLLKELIEKKAENVTDPTQLGRHWLQMQRMRAKAKKDVDTKASKGRKTRYDIHAKLVNFMAPVQAQGWSDEAKNELFASLFGKAN